MGAKEIRIRGARQHNLKGIEVSIPRERLTVVTGVSGSGKSSLALDTLFAEGRRRYVETLSSQARQMLGKLDRPEVESIEGLSPAIAIEQRSAPSHPRSTVGTATEIHHLLRLLFSKIGEPLCYRCGKPIEARSIRQMKEELLRLEGHKVHVYAPVVLRKKGDHRGLLEGLLRGGFLRARIDGELRELSEEIRLPEGEPHTVEVLVDRLEVRTDRTARLVEALETAARLGRGVVEVEPLGLEPIWFTEQPKCLGCGTELPAPSPRLFSFNDPQGACARCKGLGFERWADCDQKGGRTRPGAMQDQKTPGGSGSFIGQRRCRECGGSRLSVAARAFRVGGWALDELSRLPLDGLLAALDGLNLSGIHHKVASEILRELSKRLEVLCSLGLGYLSLERSYDSLSAGEAHRVRLATQMGCSLTGVLYILDEPSVGLHPWDQERLLEALFALRDAGNTVVVVEHDLETISRADWVVDMGPGAGELGGELLYSGPPQGLPSCPRSVTGDYLSGRKAIPLPSSRRPSGGRAIEILGASANNLKGIDVRFPLGCLSCVTGVSGSGKSSLVVDILYREASRRLHGSQEAPGSFREVRGLEEIEAVVDVDQSPIGRTPRSNPATFMGLLGPIRELFARLPEARLRGYGPDRFSFNLKGGRCEECQGEGIRCVDMLFLPNVFVTCEACGGKRFNQETLEIRYKGLDISQVLGLTVNEALRLLENIPRLSSILGTLREVGLGYLRLDQPAPSLSGGEAQRLKLARELCRPQRGRSLYILDEPTTGLHLEDVRCLLEVLERLVQAGNTVVVIEHNLEVIKCADYVIDLGPGAGQMGGEVVAVGSPEDVACNPASITGRFLKRVLKS